MQISSQEEQRRQFAHWVSTHTRSVFYALRSLGLETDLAHEATQETFFQAWRSIASFEHRSSEKTWLIGIATRVGLKLLRKQRRTSRLQDAFQRQEELQPTGHEAPEALLSHKQRHEQIRSIIGQLSDKKKVVFTLFYLEDMTVPEIAEALSMPPGTVRSTLQRAKDEVSVRWHQREQHTTPHRR